MEKNRSNPQNGLIGKMENFLLHRARPFSRHMFVG
jgi:hypothetical protein